MNIRILNWEMRFMKNYKTSTPFDLAGDVVSRLANIGQTSHVTAFFDATFSHKQFKAGLNALEETRQMSGIDSTGLIIKGIPGVGKSTLLNTFTKRIYQQSCYQPTDIMTPLPVLKTRVPGRPTIPRLIEKILQGASAFMPPMKRTDSLERRLHQLIIHQGVEMIILDEFQHFLHKNSPRSVTNPTINFIKTLADDYQLSFCFTGLPDLANVLDNFEEIKDRMGINEVVLAPFSIENNVNRDDMNTFLNSMFNKVESLGIDCTSLNKENRDRDFLLKQFVFATRGKSRHISRLIGKSLFKVQPGQALTLNHLKETYSKSTAINCGSVFNPFSAKELQVEKELEKRYLAEQLLEKEKAAEAQQASRNVRGRYGK